MGVNNFGEVQMNNNDAFVKHYAQLVGWTIEQIATDEMDYGEELYGLVLTKGKSKKIAWILRDPEGNGAGFLEIDNV